MLFWQRTHPFICRGASAEQSHKDRDVQYFSLSEQKLSVVVSVYMTPTRCQSCAVTEQVTPVPRDPLVAPYNYKPFSDHTVPAPVAHTLRTQGPVNAQCRPRRRGKRGLQCASSDAGWNLSEKPPET